jgi:hypothetical protein
MGTCPRRNTAFTLLGSAAYSACTICRTLAGLAVRLTSRRRTVQPSPTRSCFKRNAAVNEQHHFAALVDEGRTDSRANIPVTGVTQPAGLHHLVFVTLTGPDVLVLKTGAASWECGELCPGVCSRRFAGDGKLPDAVRIGFPVQGNDRRRRAGLCAKHHRINPGVIRTNRVLPEGQQKASEPICQPGLARADAVHRESLSIAEHDFSPSPAPVRRHEGTESIKEQMRLPAYRFKPAFGPCQSLPRFYALPFRALNLYVRSRLQGVCSWYSP